MIYVRRYYDALLMMASAGSLAAGTLLTVRVDSGRGGSILTHEIRVQCQHVRMDTLTEDLKQAVLYNNETRSLLVVNEEKKIFRRVSQEDAERQRQSQTEKQEQFRERIERRIRNLPPEKQSVMRKRLNRRFDSGDESRMECRRVSEGERVGSWSAERYECFVGSRRVREIWSVPWEKTGLDLEEAVVLQGFMHMRGGTSRGPRPGGGIGGFPIAAEAFPGLAVQSAEVRADDTQRGHEISSIEREDFDATLFSVDGSYTEAAAGSFMVPIR